MTCLEPTLVERHAANETSDREARAVEAHVTACGECRARLAEARADSDLAGELVQALRGAEIAATTTAPEAPALSRYRIVRRIGHGGMGIVYEAEQRSPRRRVALKVLSPTAMSARALRRFELEGEVLARLDHPGIARVYESGTFDDGGGARPFLAMELVDGVDLAAWLARTPDRDARLDLFVALAEAVAHAHRRAVLHRDLKPQNVRVTPDGRPVVLDFGVARALDLDRRADGPHTLDGQVVGTLAYMSPEQLAGDPEGVDTRADVWALGVLLHEAVADRPPVDLDGLGLADAVRAVEAAPPPRLCAADPSVDPDLELVVRKALAHDPAQRYDSAADLARDLRRYRAHEPVLARPPSAAYVARKFVRRHRLAVAVAGLFVALLLASVVLVRRQALRAEERARVTSEVQALLVAVLIESDPRRGPAGPDRRLRDALDEATARLDRQEVVDPDVEAELRHVIGSAYFGLGLYAPAERALERARALAGPERRPAVLVELADTRLARADGAGAAEAARAALATGSPFAVGRAHLVLSRAALLDGELDEAETELERARASAATARDAAPGDLRAALESQTAELRIARGQPGDALAPAEAAVDLGERAFGPGHPTTIEARLRLATLLSDGPDPGRAEEIFGEVLPAVEELLGAEHPLVANALVHMAALAQLRADEDTAFVYAERAHDLRTRLLGPDHPATLKSAALLGSLARQRGDLARARELLVGARAGLAARYGEDHPETAAAGLRVAALLEREGRPDEARAEAVRAREVLRRRLGPDHPETALAGTFLASIELARGEPERALACLEDALPHLDATWGATSLRLVHANRTRARALEELGRGDEAASSYEAILAAVAGLPQSRTEAIDEVRRQLADVRLRAGDLEGARAVYLDEPVPEDPRRRLRFANNLASLAHRAGDSETAAREFRAVLDEKLIEFGRDDTTVATAHNNLARALLATGRPDEAAAGFREAARIWTLHRGAEHFGPAWARTGLAEALLAAGDAEAALAESREALAVGRRVLSPGHARLARMLRVRGECLDAAGPSEEARALLDEAYAIVGDADDPEAAAVRRARERIAARLDG